MARLQFRHKTDAFSGGTTIENRELAIQYIKDLVDNQKVLSQSFGESLIAEPITVKYKDKENGKEQVILAIGVEGEKGESAHTEYHIIDSAKLEEDITFLSGLTQEMQEEIQEALDSIDDINDKIDEIESAITDMQESIDELDENVVKRIEINNDDKWFSGSGKPIVVEPEDNVAKIELTSDSIRIENYHGQLVHHGHSLTEFISAVEGIKFEKIEEPLEASVKEAYKLVDGDGHQMGDTLIKIYKDSHIVSITYISDPTSEHYQNLEYVYIDASGVTQTTYVNMSQLVFESEFKSGVTSTNGIVHGVVDPQSEPFLTVGANGFKVSGVQDAIDNAKTELQDELDTTQAGAGLNPDGTYKKHDRQGESNYIYEADSLDEADVILDSALKTVEDKVDNLSASTESFISETNNKISELESEIETSTSDLENKVNELSAATASEIERATNKENEIATNLATETSEREDADAILTSVVSTEINRATARENEIESALTQEIADRQAADAALSDRIDEIEDNIVVGENAIDVTVADDTAKVTLKISAADNVLTQDTNGLKTNLSVAIVREDDVEYIVLRGKNDTELSRVNANKFVKDGMLDRAYLENNNLVLIFNTDSGKEPIIIPLSDLIPVYQAGTYLTLENNVFDARIGQGGLATNESVAILSGRVEDKIAQLDGTYLQPGSIRNIINTTFSDPLTHTPVGTQEEADNNNLMRYYHPEGGADGDVRYYVSNKTTDMTHDGENLGDVINNMLEIISGIGDDIEERLENLESGLTQEIIDRQNGDNELWEALSAETEDRNNKERIISAALNDLNNKITNVSGVTEDLAAKIDELSGRTVDLSGVFADAEYYSSGDVHEIRFKNEDGTTISTINADDFIKDGMVEDAYYSGGSLYIVFNTDSGKQTIEIPIGEIFDPSLYYTKEECDELFIPAIKEKVISSALNNLNNRINDLSGVTTTIENNLNELSDDVTNNYYTKSEISDKERVISLALNMLNEKIDEVAEEAGSSEALINLSGVVVHNSEDITNLYEIAEELSGKTVDLSGYYTSGQTDELFLSKEEYEIDEKVIAAAFNDLNDRLLNTPLKQDVYTKEEVDELISGISTDIQNAVYSALKQILVGVQREIKVTADDNNKTITLGFDDNAVFGNMS